jgi:RNA polymerase sigma-70 factor (ECF subfamily)
MYLNAARLPGRTDELGDLTVLVDQDRSRWDRDLIAEGLRLLELSATGSRLSEYHVEAAIAGTHATARRFEDTRWSEIVGLYDMLLKLRPTPVVALNRAMAVAELDGPAKGLEAIASIADVERLRGYPFYAAALGELELRRGRHDVARARFQEALGLARNAAERRFLARRIADCAT